MSRPTIPDDPAGRQRVVVEHVAPSVDGGRFPVKRVVDEALSVEADVFVDGHDHVLCNLRTRGEHQRTWVETPMEPLGNDRWRAELIPERTGRYFYTVTGWVDRFGTWRADTVVKLEAGRDVSVELLAGAALLDDAASRAPARVATRLRAQAERLRSGDAVEVLADDDLETTMRRFADREHATTFEPALELVVDRERAGHGAWYEMFPRSAAAEPGRHGTFADVEALLPYVADLGFDVLYLPPIHPIGTSFRKGPNNRLAAGPDDVGSPWAIGGPEGGHKSIHPRLGTFDDFRHLVAATREHGLELALDVAFQCSPDHPYVHEHPEWFRARPDGSIQYAENPPKKYEDIYPFDFDSRQWPALWRELRSIFEFWIGEGVRIFRVDNPHTKAFPFWAWLLADLRHRYPDVILLAEAFTRPRVMERLAKIGFHQSYTYFAWRNQPWELRQYFEELSGTELAEYFRPNVWPNTPDILTDYLQEGGRPAFAIRIALATTLAASYGIFGPAFELGEHVAREPDSEEYLDSEKYQLRTWDRDDPHSLRPLISRLNRIRRQHPALRSDRSLRFHDVDNPAMLCYSKRDAMSRDTMLMVVNCDPHHVQSTWVRLDLGALGVDPALPFEVHDLLGGGRYEWHGHDNWVELDPGVLPAHVLHVEQHHPRPDLDGDHA